MFFDMRMRSASRADRERLRALEQDIVERVGTVAALITERWPDYVRSFGIVGPMAHGEGTFFFRPKPYGSDIDLAFVTVRRSLRMQRRLAAEVHEIFAGCDISAGPLFFAPSIAKRPDLMFTEYACAGKVLFGKPVPCPSRIPVWEAAKVLVSRSGALLDTLVFSGDDIHRSAAFPYGWSKAVLGLGEAALILDRRFAFTLRERSKRIAGTTFARHERHFGSVHRAAVAARYRGTVKNPDKTLAMTFSLLAAGFGDVTVALERASGSDVASLRAPFPTIIGTRTAYLRYALGQRRVPTTSEPFVKTFLDLNAIFAQLAAGMQVSDAERERAVWYWKRAGEFRFWLPY